MNLIKRVLQVILAIAFAAATFMAVARVHAATITVDTIEEIASNNGNCSIREAIQAANTDAVVDTCLAGSGVGTDTIAFNIGGGGAQTITLTSPLAVTSPVVIDGGTQPGFSAGSPGVPLIMITGSPSDLIMFQTGSSGSSIRGLRLVNTLTGSLGRAVRLETDSITVAGNYFNTDGTASLGGDDTIGVILADSAISTIGGAAGADRNLFGGVNGVRVDNGSGNTIRGNYFGVTSGGSAALSGLSGSGYAIDFCAYGCTSSHSNYILGNVITGFYAGISLAAPAALNDIKGNFIGIGVDGTTKLPNSYGIYLSGSDSNTLGGTTSADRNVISGNTHNMYFINSSTETPDSNVIQGNYIGTTADGLGRTTAFGDSTRDIEGIDIESGAGNLIGGTLPGSGNVVSGNGYGIIVGSEATGTIIRGNLIGVDATGNAGLRQIHNIKLNGTSANIGDSTTPGNNVISGADVGVYLTGSTGSTIYGNRIGVGAFGMAHVGNGWGIVLSGTSSSTIARNWIGFNNYDGLMLYPAATVNALSTHNCFTSDTSYGVESLNIGTSAPFSNNWWGSSTGPTHSGNPGGTGDDVTDYVNYAGFRTSAPAACQHPTADFEGDGKSDLGYFHPSTGLWGILQSAHGHDYGYARYFTWGTTGDIVTPADYDGDGIVDPTVRRPPSGGQSAAYLILRSSTNYNYGLSLTIPAGWPGLGDTPVIGDFNGDGISDPGIWRGSAGVWIIPLSPSFGSYAFYSWGVAGDKPIAADVDGDGQTDIGYWRPSTGVWGFLRSSTGYSYTSPMFFSWGTSTDKAVMADYDGDGYADPAVVIPPAGGMSQAYRILLSSAGYSPASSVTVPAGWPGLSDTPAPADYDGDGLADPAIWRGNTGVWIVPLSSGSYTTYLFRAWGATGDVPAR